MAGPYSEDIVALYLDSIGAPDSESTPGLYSDGTTRITSESLARPKSRGTVGPY